MNKKFLLTTILLLTMVVCPALSQDIVGTWKCISSYDVVEGKELTNYMKGQYLTVNADGTYTSTSDEMGYGSYTFQGNQFSAKNNKGAKFTATVSVDGNNLTMEGSSSYGVSFTYVFERVDQIDIVGTWKCISSYDVVEGKEITDYMKGQYLTVNADGTYTSTSDEMGYGSYTFQGDQFSAKNNKGAKFTATVSVDGNYLTLEGSSSYGVSFTYVFERVDQIDILGTWKCISSYDVVEGKELTNYMKGQYLTVNADGTYTSTSKEMGHGTYSFGGNSFVAQNNLGVTFTATLFVSSDQLTMEGRSSSGVTFQYVFEKSSGEPEPSPGGKIGDVFEIDGLKYEICESNTVSIIPNDGEYSGDIVIPDQVTINGASYSVTTIGERAFSFCSGLTSIIIPNSVTNIGDFAFSDSSRLTYIIVSNGNTTYDSRDNCNAIIETASNTLVAGCSNSTIPNSVTSIGTGAFSGCRGFTSITIPNSVTSIGDYAFLSCRTLATITIPNSVTFIGQSAFEDCNSITSLSIGYSVASIGWHAFDDCRSLLDVYCYAVKVPETDVDAFGYQSNDISNATLHVPASSIEVYKASLPWSNFKEIVALDEEGNVETKRTIHVAQAGTLSSYISEEEKYQIEELTLTGEINGTDFKTIRRMLGAPSELYSQYYNYGYGWGNEDTKLRSLDISGARIVAGGTYIENHQDPACDLHLNESDIIPARVFDGCKNLVSIAIPDNVNFIGSFALRGTAWYDAQPDGLVYLGKVLYTYKGNDIPSKITIEDGTLGIAGDAFADQSIESVTIPESVTRIGDGEFYFGGDNTPGFRPLGKGAFEGCTRLKDVYCYAENVPDTKMNPFWGTDIESGILYVPAGSIDAYKAAEPWSNFKEILPIEGSGSSGSCGENLTWKYDEATKALTISGTGEMDSYTLIGSPWYELRKSIQSLVIEDGVTTIGNCAFASCDRMTSVTIPNSITSIGSSAFWYSGITSFVINNNISRIEQSTFYGCHNLETLVIGRNVSFIGDGNFIFCGLKDIYCYAEDVPWAEKAFEGVEVDGSPDDITLHVAANSIKDYQSSYPWSNFKEIVALDASGIKSIEADNRVIQINSIRGERLSAPSKGINIIKMKDGTTKKILVK